DPWLPHVAGVARPPGDPDFSTTIRPPSFNETAIETPWRLVLSTGEEAHWMHDTVATTHPARPGRTGSTRDCDSYLRGAKIPQHGPSPSRIGPPQPLVPNVRAVWMPGFELDHPPTTKPFPFTGTHGTSLTETNRYDIVRLTSDYSAFDDGAPYTPKPVVVN